MEKRSNDRNEKYVLTSLIPKLSKTENIFLHDDDPDDEQLFQQLPGGINLFDGILMSKVKTHTY